MLKNISGCRLALRGIRNLWQGVLSCRISAEISRMGLRRGHARVGLSFARRFPLLFFFAMILRSFIEPVDGLIYRLSLATSATG